MTRPRNGEEAIEHLKTGQPFDLLFTDIVLPGGMNGVEIAEEAKRRQPNIKVLYATGYAESAVVHSGRLWTQALSWSTSPTGAQSCSRRFAQFSTATAIERRGVGQQSVIEAISAPNCTTR